MVLGRAHHPAQRRPMDLACHHLEKKMTRETSQAMDGRPGQILEGNDLEDDSARQVNLEAAEAFAQPWDTTASQPWDTTASQPWDTTASQPWDTTASQR